MDGIDFSDIIKFGNTDQNVKVIALYAEGIKNAQEFVQAVKESKKPIIVCMPRGEVGKTNTHTGAVAPDIEVFKEVCRKLGVVFVEDMETLWLASTILERNAQIEGNRVIAIGNAGGNNQILRSKALTLGRIAFPDISEKEAQIKTAVGEKFPAFCVSNPLDATAAVSPQSLIQMLGVLKESADCFIIDFGQGPPAMNVLGNTKTFAEMAEAIVQLGKPVIAISDNSEHGRKLLSALSEHGIPVCTRPDEALGAIGAILEYGKKEASGYEPVEK